MSNEYLRPSPSLACLLLLVMATLFFAVIFVIDHLSRLQPLCSCFYSFPIISPVSPSTHRVIVGAASS